MLANLLIKETKYDTKERKVHSGKDDFIVMADASVIEKKMRQYGGNLLKERPELIQERSG